MPLSLEEQYPAFADRIGKAREVGYKDDEIWGYIQDKIKTSQDAGFTEQEIFDYLGSPMGFQPLTEEDLSGSDAITGAAQPPPEPVEPVEPGSYFRPDAVSQADPGQGVIRTRHQLDLEDEYNFQKWYKKHADKWGLNPNPDDPGHKYDYRGAWLAGAEGDETGHLPSQFKDEDHPNRFVDGIDTITGEPAETKITPGAFEPIPELSQFDPIPELKRRLGEDEEPIPELRQMKQRGLYGLQAGLTEGEPPPKPVSGTSTLGVAAKGALQGTKRLPFRTAQMMGDMVAGAEDKDYRIPETGMLDPWAVIGAGLGGVRSPEASKLAQGLSRRAGRRLEGDLKLSPDVQGSLVGRGVATGIEMFGPMAVATIPAILTGAPLAAVPTTMALFGLSTFKNTYDELIEAGVPPTQAFNSALLHGISEGGIETIGTVMELFTLGMGKPVAKAFKTGARAAAKRFLKKMGAVFLEEYGEELAQGGTEAWLKNKYKDNPKVQQLNWEDVVVEPIIPVAVTALLLGGGAKVIEKAGERKRELNSKDIDRLVKNEIERMERADMLGIPLPEEEEAAKQVAEAILEQERQANQALYHRKQPPEEPEGPDEPEGPSGPEGPSEPPPGAPGAPTEGEKGDLEGALKAIGEKPPEVKLAAKIDKIDSTGRMKRVKTRYENQIKKLPEDKQGPLLEKLNKKEQELKELEDREIDDIQAEAEAEEEAIAEEQKLQPEKEEPIDEEQEVKDMVEGEREPLEEEAKPEEEKSVAEREQERIDKIDTTPYEELAKPHEGVTFSSILPTEQGDFINYHDEVSGGDFAIPEKELTPETLEKRIKEIREELPEVSEEERAAREETLKAEKEGAELSKEDKAEIEYTPPTIPAEEAEEATKGEEKKYEFDTATTGMPFYDEILNEKIPGYFKEKKGIEYEIKEMTPDEYLDEITKGFWRQDKALRGEGKTIGEAFESVEALREFVEGDRLVKGKVEEYMARWEKGEKPPLPVIEYKSDGFMNQEGAHRAVMAKKAGLKTMPVMRVYNNISKEDLAKILEEKAPEAKKEEKAPEAKKEEKAPEAKKEEKAPEFSEEKLKADVEAGGGIWKGWNKGFVTKKNQLGLVEFDSPYTGSTLALPPNEVTPQAVKDKLVLNYLKTLRDNASLIEKRWEEIDGLTQEQKDDIIKGEKEPKDAQPTKPVREGDRESLEGKPPEAVPPVEGEEEGAGVLPKTGGKGDTGTRTGVEKGAEPRPDKGTGERRGEAAERKGSTETRREVSIPGYNYHITPQDQIAEVGGEVDRFNRNFDAIQLLKKLEEEGRLAHPNEQAILVKYVGWGGLKKVFRYNDEQAWNNRRKQLEELLTEEEWRAARNSVTNAHYSPPKVIDLVYQALNRIGFKGGKVLEPAAGIGHFIGVMPKSMARRSKFTAIELDPISARIAKQLYQGHDVREAGYETQKLPNNFYDVAVSNVPFGEFAVYDKEYPKLRAHIHDYYFIKTLDKVKPGGIVVFVTSRYTLDKKDSKYRRMIAEKADLLGAIRLPDSAFLSIANTEVVADIVILRKKVQGEIFKGEPFVETRLQTIAKGGDQGNVNINEYFINNPDMIQGEPSLTGSMYAESTYTVKGTFEDVSETFKPLKALDNILKKIPKKVYVETQGSRETFEPTPDDIVGVEGQEREGSYVVTGKNVFQWIDGKLVGIQYKTGQLPRAKKLIGVKDAVRKLIRVQLEPDAKEGEFTELQKQLNKKYDEFVAKYGFLNDGKNWKLLAGDPDVPVMLATEKWDAKNKTAVKTAFFTQRTIQQYSKPTSADTAQDALMIALAEKGRVDLERMAELTGKDEESLTRELQGIIYKDPEGEEWVQEQEYLSGDVKTKLQNAINAAKLDETYEPNIEALEKVQPPDVPPDEIHVRLGGTWIPEDDYKDFIKDLLGSTGVKVKVDYVSSAGTWVVRARDRWSTGDTTWSRTNYPQSAESRSTYSMDQKSTLDLVEAAFNARTIVIRLYDDQGKSLGIDHVATAEAKELQERIQDRFREWFLENEERTERLSALYNEEMNRTRNREDWDGSHLVLPGKNPAVILKKHQLDAIWRVIISRRNTLLEHEVGAGKTYAMIAAAMEMKRLGLAKKPMLICYKHQVPDFQRSIYELYPAARALVATTKSFEPQNRRKIQAQITTGDWDLIVLSHEQMEKLPMSNKAQQEYIQELLWEAEVALMDARQQGLRDKDPTVRQLVAALTKINTKLQRLIDNPKDTGVTFEEIGVDMLFVDEAQKFKNLQYTSTRTRVSGLGDPDGSARAFDLYMKTKYLTKHNQGKGIVFASATPISNSMVEMYTVLRFLYPESLEQRRIKMFDAWAAQFGEDVTALEVDPAGKGFKQTTRFRKFVNMPELLQMYREVSDIQTQEMLQLPRPDIKDGSPDAVAIKASQTQRMYVDHLVERAEAIRRGGVDPSIDNMFKITTEGRKCAIDMRLIDPQMPDDVGSKVNKSIENIFDIWKKYESTGSTQLVFLDYGTPGTEGFNLYDDMKEKLVRLGVPAEEIAFIHDAKNEANKTSLFTQVKEGKVRILFGSTKKMGTGMNVQDKAIALHHIDPPWTPAEIEQREGRILRQGNENKEIQIYRYATEGTFDAYMWQTLENKQGFLNQIKSGDATRSVEDIDGRALSYAEMKAIASGDPIVRERIETEMRVNELRSLHKAWEKKRTKAQETLANAPSRKRGYYEEREKLVADIKTRDENPMPKDGYLITLKGKEFKTRKEAAVGLVDAIVDSPVIDPADPATPIGQYRGFKLGLKKYRVLKSKLIIGGASNYPVDLPDVVKELSVERKTGVLQRLENQVEKLEETLKSVEEQISRIEEEEKAAKKTAEADFEHKDELRAKERRMDELADALEPGTVAADTGTIVESLEIGDLKEGEEIFEVANTEGERTKVKGKRVDIREGFEFFVHLDEKGKWRVSEKKSGVLIAISPLQKNAIKEAREKLESKTDEEINEAIERALKQQKELRGEETAEEPVATPDEIKDETNIAYGSERKMEQKFKSTAKMTDQVGQSFAQSVANYKSKIGQELVNKKSVSFVGRQLTEGWESREIAEMFQVFRTPRIEILHTIYTDAEGRILAHNAETSGHVAEVNFGDIAKFASRIKSQMKRLNATKVHILHNHPTGNPQFSEGDVRVYSALLERLGNRVGETIVIDHGKFSRWISVDRAEIGEYKIDPAAGRWALEPYKSLRTSGEMASFIQGIMKGIDTRRNSVFIYLDPVMQVKGWAVQSNALLGKETVYGKYGKAKKGFGKIMQEQLRAHNATRVAIITADPRGKDLILQPIPWAYDVMILEGQQILSLRYKFPEQFKRTVENRRSIPLFEEEFTPEQEEAMQIAKEGVAKLMFEARQKGVRFTREYLKGLGYDGKQIRQIFKVKKLLAEERAKLGTPKENAVMVLRQFIKDKEAFSELDKLSLIKLKRILKRAVVDVSGNIKPELMKFGKPGKEVVMNHDLIAGATPHGVMQYEDWANKIYGDAVLGRELGREDELILESLIRSRRIVTIENYVEKPQKHPGRLTKEHHADYLDYENFSHAVKQELKMDVSEDLYRELVQRADLYFQAFDDQLKQLFENHLISVQSFDALIAIGDYQPRRFIQHIDPEQSYSFGTSKTITVRSSGIKRLVGGSFEALETDARKLLLQTIISSQNRIAKNNANIALWDLADQIPDNAIVEKAVVVGKYPSGAPKYEKPPAGYEQIDVMIEGQKRRMNMKNEWAREWVMRDPAIDSQMANILGWALGAKILRPMATGMFAPEFAITNLARDAAHLWLVTDAFSKHLPVALEQYRKALKAVYMDAIKKEGLYLEYIKRGGGMSFMTHQGQMGTDPSSHWLRYKTIKTLKDFEKYGSYVGETSEILNRLVLMQQYMWKLGIKKHKPGSPEYEAIMKEAVWQARTYIDFSQGGSWVKAIDVGVPYLNAAVQGTRGIGRAAWERPKETAWKVSWLMTLAIGLYFANRFINPEAYDQVSDSDKVRYWILTTPFKFVDSKGNTRHLYFAIAKDQGQRFFAQIAEQSMRAITGEKVIWDQLKAGGKDMLPIIPTETMPPLFDAIYGYRNNKDFWLNKDIWQNKFYEVGKIEPRSEYTRYSHPALVRMGDILNMSPERMGYALQQYFTYGNIFTWLVGGGLRLMMQGLPGNEGDKILAEMVTASPGIRKGARLTRVTTDQERRDVNDVLVQIYTRRFEQNRKIMDLSEDYYAKQKQEMPEAELALDKIQKYIDSQPEEDRARILKLYEDYPKYDDIPDRSWWISLRPMPAEAKAYVYFSKWIRSTEKKRQQMDEMRGDMPGMMSDRFMTELDKLHEQAKELKE